MNNPLKSQIAANRERFDEKFEVNKDGFVGMGYIHDVKPYKNFLTTSLTSAFQTAIAAVEGMKIKVSSEDELVKRDGYRDPELQDYEIDVAKSYNEALSKVVELLKGGIDN